MEMLNRSAVILKPRQPYLDWTRRDDNEGLADTVFENLRTEPTVYLLPDYEDPPTQREVLEEFWPALLEAMLAGWSPTRSCGRRTGLSRCVASGSRSR